MNKPSTSTLRQTTAVMSALSILPHLFCCGIPAIMAIISLGTTAGLAGVLATNPLYRMVDAYHEILIGLAIGSVLVSGALNWVAYRIDCHTAASHCGHGDCTPKKNKSLRLFLLSCVLLVLDLGWFATEKFALGLHDHGHEHAHGVLHDEHDGEHHDAPAGEEFPH